MSENNTDTNPCEVFELKIPKNDVELFKAFVNKMGWEITNNQLAEDTTPQLSEHLPHYAKGLLVVHLYPLMFRVLSVVHSRIPYIKYNLYIRNYNGQEYIVKANDSNSLLPITLELEEPELNKFAAQAKEIGIVYHCDSVIGFGIKPNAGFRLYVRVFLMEDDYFIPLINKHLPYGEQASERDSFEFALKIGNSIEDIIDKQQFGLIEV